MGGGLMQLVAYGAQDIYLTGNPQITFFKVVYRRHTNFAMEAIEQTWNGSAVAASGRCTATISRNGDLVNRMYLELTGTSSGAQPIDVAAVAITDIELEIGGQKIDKQTGHWMNVWSYLTEPNPTGRCGDHLDQTGTLFQNMSGMGGVMASDGSDALHHFVPLQFWFCRNPGLALPLIALQYHEVKVILNHTIGATNNYVTTPSNKLWCDYIYLDTDERRRFAQVSHEYLIEQVQEQAFSTATTQELNFNHPVKELIWTCAEAAQGALKGTSLILCTGFAVGGTFQLKLNGHDRFAARNYRYFSRTQVREHHTGCGGLSSAAAWGGASASNDSICVYSFALKPEEHQPSGTCNFSRIDNAQLVSSQAFVAETTMYAINYNVLRIMSGMGGLAYSN